MKSSFSKGGKSASRYSPSNTSSYQEPSTYYGKMYTSEENSVLIDIILGVSAETIHAIADHQQKLMFQSPVALVKEIVWDHSEKSVHFVLDDGSTSPTFVFAVLTELETHLSAIVELPDLEKPPEQLYIGVLIGQNLPSPIQQRRAFLGSSQPSMLPMAKRRELLRKEQPVRNAMSRERLGVEFMRSGSLCFTCSIGGDLRGLTLSIHQMHIFPSPDCHDRIACLFSYGYEYLESCEVSGTRLELRFRTTHQVAKQPSYLVFQSLEAQYIREAIWYLKNGTYMDVSLRKMILSPPRTNIEASSPTGDNTAKRTGVLMFFADVDSLKQRIDSCCRVIGCPNLIEWSDQSCSKPDEVSTANMMTYINGRELSNVSPRVLRSSLCEFHASCLSNDRQRSFVSRDKPQLPAKILQPLTSLLQSSHYTKMFKFQGQLQKRQSTRTFHLRKAWHPKLVVLFETPVGGFLCYYDKLTHCPGLSDSPKERRVIDLSSVLCIRPVSAASPLSRSTNASLPTMHAFDVVTLYRTWTFAALEPEEYEVWLHVLTEGVEKHATISPDKIQRFSVKLAMTGQTCPTEATSLEISSHGVSFCTGHEGEVVLNTWYYTDLEKWSVVFQQGYTCCLLRCRSSPPASPGSPRAGSGEMIIQDYLFRTSDASDVCLAIEFYVGKCMAKLEILAGQFLEETRAQMNKTTVVLDPVISKRSAGNMKFEIDAVKEYPIENLSLAPIGRDEDMNEVRIELRQQDGAKVDAVGIVIIDTAGEESLVLASDEEVLLTNKGREQENCNNDQLEQEPVVTESVNEEQSTSSGDATATVSEMRMEGLVEVTSSEKTGVELVIDGDANGDANNSEMGNADMLEETEATGLRDRNAGDSGKYLTTVAMALVSQVFESKNTVSLTRLDGAALIETDDKILYTHESSKVDERDDSKHEVDSVKLSEGIELIDLRMERALNVVRDSEHAEQEIKLEVDDTVAQSILDDPEFEHNIVSVQESTELFSENMAAILDERKSKTILTVLTPKVLPDSALESCLKEYLTLPKCDELVTMNLAVDALEEHHTDTFKFIVTPEFPISAEVTSVPSPLLLLEYLPSWPSEQEKEEINEKLIQSSVSQEIEDDDRTSECEVSDTFDSCSSEIELTSQDDSSLPIEVYFSTDCTDDLFEDAIQDEILLSHLEAH